MNVNGHSEFSQLLRWSLQAAPSSVVITHTLWVDQKSLGQWAHRPLESWGLHIYIIHMGNKCYTVISYLLNGVYHPISSGFHIKHYQTIGLDIGEPLLDSKPLQTTWFSAKMMPLVVVVPPSYKFVVPTD